MMSPAIDENRGTYDLHVIPASILAFHKLGFSLKKGNVSYE
jgi:hypothetical protein